MRASAASRSAEPFREHGESTDLTRAMLAAVSEELDLPLSDERMRQEFAAHVTFLVNRLTYKVGAQADVLADFPQTYPLAHYMASIAAHELGRYLGTEVPEAEVALLATYFNLSPESPDGRFVLYYTSDARGGETGASRKIGCAPRCARTQARRSRA